MSRYIISLDQGTTSSRAVLYSEQGEELAKVSRALSCRYPQEAWVEQDANEIWETQRVCLEELLRPLTPGDVLALGITNQRETTIAWDKQTGEPLCPAIVWQCRRTADICRSLRDAGHEALLRAKTGLILDPYFSATKMRWMLENYPQLKDCRDSGALVFGTVDSWIVFKLTQASGTAVIKTEPSNASRTMLMDLNTDVWDAELLALFGISNQELPEIVPSIGTFGQACFDGHRIPITAVLGDQQAALFGHKAFSTRDAKCTFGTGAFLLMNDGENRTGQTAGLLETVAWKLNASELSIKAIEGSVFVAGSAIQWLKDSLGIIRPDDNLEELLRLERDSGGIIFVPSFVGLGSPYWDDTVRGALFGLTRNSSRAQIVRAAFEGVAHQVADLLATGPFAAISRLSVDGGMTENLAFCELLADITQRSVVVPPSSEMTAFGAASAAALGAGLYGSLAELTTSFGIKKNDSVARTTLQPKALDQEGQKRRDDWKDAIERLLGPNRKS